MSTSKTGILSQQGLAGFGDGNVVSMDGGKRLRLDERVDFWPGTQAWHTVLDGPDGPASGVGLTSLLNYLKRIRAAEGRPIATPQARPSDRKVTCNYCGRFAELHAGPAVYPDRKELLDRQFWVCWPCDAWVGCKINSDEPFGELADEGLRAARIAAHKAFDPIWENEILTKQQAYDWLAQALAIPRRECKIGLLKLDDCAKVSPAVWERFGQLLPPE